MVRPIVAGRDELVRATVCYVTGGLLGERRTPRLFSLDDDRPNAR